MIHDTFVYMYIYYICIFILDCDMICVCSSMLFELSVAPGLYGFIISLPCISLCRPQGKTTKFRSEGGLDVDSDDEFSDPWIFATKMAQQLCFFFEGIESPLHPGKSRWNLKDRRFGRWSSFFIGWCLGSSRSFSRVYPDMFEGAVDFIAEGHGADGSKIRAC